MNRIEIEKLETRQQFSSIPAASFDGLPREVTQVDDTLYFALDDRLDGKLSYVDLVSYDLSSGKQRSIRRDDGKPFGSVQYHLSKAGDRLLIAEEFTQNGYTKGYELWTLRPGDSRAQRLVQGQVGSIPQQFEQFDDRVFFITSENLYYFEVSTDGPAKLSYDPTSVGVVYDIASFGGGIAVFVGDRSFQDIVAQKVYYGSGLPGSLKRMKKLPSGLTDVTGFSAAGSLVLNVDVGGTSRVYTTTDGVTLTGQAATRDPTSSTARPVSQFAVEIFVESSIPNTSVPVIVRKNLKNGKVFTATYDQSIGTWSRVDAVLYGTSSLPMSLNDDEAVGGYVAPAYSGSSSYSSNVTYSYSTPFLSSINMRTGKLTSIATSMRDSELGAFSAAGGFVDVGGTTYFAAGRTKNEYRPNNALFSTDGTNSGTMSHGQLAWGPFVADREVYYFPSLKEGTLMRLESPIGAINGRVVIDPNAAKVFSDEMQGLKGRRVYVDLNRNGRFDKNAEPNATTDQYGNYRIDHLEAGKWTVRISAEAGWEATRGWEKTIKVASARSKTVSFGLRDTLASASFRGTAYSLRGYTAFLDLNRSGLLEDGEPTSSVRWSDGTYRFKNLTAGDYLIRFLFFVPIKKYSSSSEYIWLKPGETLRK